MARTFENPLPDAKNFGENLLSNETLLAVLQKSKTTAESWLGESSKTTVIAVPEALISDPIRALLKQLGEEVGLDVLRVSSALTSAARGHKLDVGLYDEEPFLIFNMGRDNFEVSVINIDQGVVEVFSSSMNNHLSQAFGPFAYELDGQARETSAKEVANLVEHVIEKADLNKKDVPRVIMTGEFTQHPAIRAMLEEFFNYNSSVEYFVHSEWPEAVTLGTAMISRILTGRECAEVQYMSMVLPRSIGVGIAGGVTSQMVQRNTPIPTAKILNFTTTLDNQTVVIIPIVLGGFVATAKNQRIATLRLEGIPPAPRGEPVINVRIAISEDETQDAAVLLSANATLIDSQGDISINHHMILDDWISWNDDELYHLILKEEAENGYHDDICRRGPYLDFDESTQVSTKDFDNLDDWWVTDRLRAKADVQNGHAARALCFYEKALPYFPIGHSELHKEIKALWKQVPERMDHSAFNGAENAFRSRLISDCYGQYP
ncbi:Heat shock 70 kDa protein cognate 2 [Colletotrichum gloeosporioides]|uniref:Heat shock 70 kDa protein cognate 2 n=1 Tax=Colletotrichum gloeosporioides TaxID=474922 RepID=A0A8H4CY14_COLGL|nr:Heat shock 70 kDa protein cognate 2 [Colletotrichum gloeosporioides]KAF3812183.1 Heat shock 70 kDa protein cognate 2 [Colletotrichum gloeosporioides]